MRWNVRRIPSRARRYTGSFMRSWPANVSVPESGITWPHTQLKKVVLPAPFGPTMPTDSPTFTVTETSARAWRPPKRLEMCSATSSGSPG